MNRPANFLEIVEACVRLMRREGQDHFEASDGDFIYRLSLNGTSLNVQATEVVIDPGLVAEGVD